MVLPAWFEGSCEERRVRIVNLGTASSCMFSYKNYVDSVWSGLGLAERS